MKFSALLTLALGLAVASPISASAQQFYSGHPHGHRHVQGRIVAVGSSDFKIDDGQTVFLHHGTVINPTGARLQPGQYVTVDGVPTWNHNVNANVVSIDWHRWNGGTH
jgi:hypothetical protein